MAIFLKRNNFQEQLSNWIQGNQSKISKLYLSVNFTIMINASLKSISDTFCRQRPRKPFVWGTCAGLILLSNKIEETMKGGQVKVGRFLKQIKRHAYLT